MSDAARQALSAWLPDPGRLLPLGRGHINDTWLVQSPRARFVLQRLSAAVFPRPLAVMDTVARVVGHLKGSTTVRVPDLVVTRRGERWHQDANGGVWRLWEHVENTRTLEQLTRAAQGQAAGRAFGCFQLAVADLPGRVPDPIPHFMRLSHYLGALDRALEAGVLDREADAVLALVGPRRELAQVFTRADRLIHGDCKINNLLFHRGSDEVACIIDLDTVMHGHWAWDFGDLVRSAAADADRVNVARFAAIVRGFLHSGALGDRHIVPRVMDELVLAPRYVTFMLGVRFLTDHLRGDRYFKVESRGENLRRARMQLNLLQDMERQESAMRAAVTAPG